MNWISYSTNILSSDLMRLEKTRPEVVIFNEQCHETLDLWSSSKDKITAAFQAANQRDMKFDCANNERPRRSERSRVCLRVCVPRLETSLYVRLKQLQWTQGLSVCSSRWPRHMNGDGDSCGFITVWARSVWRAFVNCYVSESLISFFCNVFWRGAEMKPSSVAPAVDFPPKNAM